MANLQALLGGAGAGFLVGGPPGALVGASAAWLLGLGDDTAVTPATPAPAATTVAAPGTGLNTDTDTGIVGYVPIATGSANLTPGSMPMMPTLPMMPTPITPTHIIVGDDGGGNGGLSSLDPNDPSLGGGFAPPPQTSASAGSLPLIAPSPSSHMPTLDPNDPRLGGGFAPAPRAPITIAPVVIALPPPTPPALGPFVDPNDPAHGGGFVGGSGGIVIGTPGGGLSGSGSLPPGASIPIVLPIVTSAPVATTGASVSAQTAPVVILQPPTTGGRRLLNGWSGGRR